MATACGERGPLRRCTSPLAAAYQTLRVGCRRPIRGAKCAMPALPIVLTHTPLLQVRPASGASATCVAVRFDAFTARLGGLPEAAFSLGWLRPLGYVDTIFLDDEMRVSVGDKGGLFVLRRVINNGAGGEAADACESPAAAGR